MEFAERLQWTIGPIVNLFGICSVMYVINDNPLHIPLRDAQLCIKFMIFYFMMRVLFYCVTSYGAKLVLTNASNISWVYMEYHGFKLLWTKYQVHANLAALKCAYYFTNMLVLLLYMFPYEIEHAVSSLSEVHLLSLWTMYFWSRAKEDEIKFLRLYTFCWILHHVLCNINVDTKRFTVLSLAINELYCVTGNLCLARYVIGKSVERNGIIE